MPMRRVGPREAHELVSRDGYVYVDVRSVPEFEAGHPEGAYNIPILHMGAFGMQANAEFLDVVRRTFPPGTGLVLGCKAGGRSLRAASMLQAEGYANVVDQRAGYDGVPGEPGWAPAGLPVSTSAVPGRSWDELRSAP